MRRSAISGIEQQQKKGRHYHAVIVLPEATLSYYNRLLNMTGPEIYQKYGLKRYETFTHTARFENGFEADITLVICEEDPPYIDAVFFDAQGLEITCKTGEYRFNGDFRFEDDDGSTYVVEVISETAQQSEKTEFGGTK